MHLWHSLAYSAERCEPAFRGWSSKEKRQLTQTHPTSWCRALEKQDTKTKCKQMSFIKRRWGKGKKYHKPQFMNVSGKFFSLMLQMFYSVEVIPSSTIISVSAFKRICLSCFPSLEAMLLHIISAARTTAVLAERMQLACCWK